MTGMAAFGAMLRMGQGNTVPGPETFDEIANVSNIGGPGLSVDLEDTTSHDSTGGWEEAVATVLRTGELTLEINYDPEDGTHDAATGLSKKLKDKTLTNFKLIFNTDPVEANRVHWDFSAYVTGFEPAAPHNGKLTASVKLKPTGQPTLA